jgi:hypothetical protein
MKINSGKDADIHQHDSGKSLLLIILSSVSILPQSHPIPMAIGIQDLSEKSFCIKFILIIMNGCCHPVPMTIGIQDLSLDNII